MLRIYTRENECLAPYDLTVTGESEPVPPAGQILWIDLLNPTAEEDRFVEKIVGVSIPTREEMEEIEVSSRLYNEDGGEFMTMAGLAQLDTESPLLSPITFVLKGQILVTVRFAEPRPFLDLLDPRPAARRAHRLVRRADHAWPAGSAHRPDRRRAGARGREDRHDFARGVPQRQHGRQDARLPERAGGDRPRRRRALDGARKPRQHDARAHLSHRRHRGRQQEGDQGHAPAHPLHPARHLLAGGPLDLSVLESVASCSTRRSASSTSSRTRSSRSSRSRPSA